MSRWVGGWVGERVVGASLVCAARIRDAFACSVCRASVRYGMATMSGLLKSIGLFCKRAL